MLKLIQGDCLQEMKNIPDNSIDSIVTDPPYGLSDHKPQDVQACLAAWVKGEPYLSTKKGFMGKTWDSWVPGPEVWREAYRVLKPGAHIACFAGSRTHDLMSIALRMAGFECRDTVMWVYGSGFPKSLAVSKAIDKQQGVERQVIGTRTDGRGKSDLKISNQETGCTGIRHADGSKQVYEESAATSEDAKKWVGFGTALKPAYEPVLLFRKPLVGTVASNVLEFGTGSLNIDGCRIPTDSAVDDPRLGGNGTWSSDKMAKNVYEGGYSGEIVGSSPLGRFPANLIHDGSEEVLNTFPDAKGQQGDLKNHFHIRESPNSIFGAMAAAKDHPKRNDSSVSAARFFYCAKASKADRNEGCDGLEDGFMAASNQAQAELKRGNMHQGDSGINTVKVSKNNHPTVKPTDLMAYVCRLITPPNGVVLDPFMGSGSTGKACGAEDLSFIGIEQDQKYFAIAEARIINAYAGDLC